MTPRPCPWCGVQTVRLPVRGTIRAVDALPHPAGSLEVDLHAGTAVPTKHEGPTQQGNRHHLHRDTCTDWQGAAGG